MELNTVHHAIIVMASILAILIIIRVVWALSLNKISGDVGFAKTCGSRERQEDCHIVKRSFRGTLAVLADGMGRNQGGAVSSSLAVETVLDVFDRDNPFLNPNYFFQKAFRQANNRILDQLSDSYGGASVAIALFDRKTLYYALAGNVQIAVFRGHDLVQITEGHTVNVLAEKKYTVGSLTKQETISLLRERRLYNYVGRDEFCDVEIFDAPVHLRQGDIVVLMTDGVYESVPHTDIEKILSSVRGCQEKANAIIKAVDEFDGVKDNASVVLIAI